MGSIISGGETRDWIFSNPVSERLSMPAVMLYKDGKTVGANIKGRNVLHIADLNNEGSSPRDFWVPIIGRAGGNIKNILFYLDRMEDGVKVMRDLGLNAYAVAPLDAHAWDYLMKIPDSGVTPEIYRQLMNRMEDKNGWARKMLRSDTGLTRLVGLFDNSREREKVRKVLTHGYPDMKDELLEAIESRTKSGLDVKEWWMGF